MNKIKVPIRYLPKTLSRKDKKKQTRMLLRSRKMYKSNHFYTRKKVKSFTSKPSNHVKIARNTFKVKNLKPSKELAKASGCTMDALNKIVNKGAGAYFSSGSRPNQTAQSWGIARLASSLTGGKAAAVDYDILDNGCNHKKKAFILAKKARTKYNHGTSKARKITIH
jgi:hypothetical protein